MYRSFLAYLLNEVMPRPFAAIAAGHAATDVDDKVKRIVHLTLFELIEACPKQMGTATFVLGAANQGQA